jgi:citrate lyase synthetase
MKELLPANGISFEEIPRLSDISAGRVRSLIEAGSLEAVRKMVPESSYEIIQRRS